MNGNGTKEKRKPAERLESTLFALLQEKSFDEISITELCAAAGVARKTFYRKFADMNEIIEKAFLGVFGKLTDAIDFTASDAKSVYSVCFEYLAAHKNLTSAFVDPSLHNTVTDVLRGCVETAFEKTYYNTVALDPTVSCFVAPFIAEGLISIIRTWVASGFKHSPQMLASLAERLLSGVLV